MFTNGKVLKFIKDHLVSIIVFLVVVVLAFIGVRSCQRHLDVDFTASRNRIVIEYCDKEHGTSSNSNVIDKWRKK